MTLFVYITETCQQSAKKHQLTDALDKLVADIEREQALFRLDSFPHPFWVKKRLGTRHTRLVCRLESHKIEGEIVEVLVCLNIFQRGDKDYDKLYVHIRDSGDVLYRQVTEQSLLKEWLHQRCQQEVLPRLPKPSQEEDVFLYAVPPVTNYHEYGNITERVYESWSWVERGLKLCSPSQLENISEQLAIWNTQTPRVPYILAEFEEGDVWILPFDEHRICVLTFDDNTNDAALTANFFKEKGAELNTQDFQQYLGFVMRRVYMQSLLANAKQWLNVQQNVAANLVFSPEESSILYYTAQEKRPYPLFINGRAGSGKSTILQYLFSSYLNVAYQQVALLKTPIYPVYFTCNQTLSDRAADTINQILQTYNSQNAWLALIKSVCLEFRGFLLQLIPTEQQAQFLRDTWLDYGRFRRLWEQKFGQQAKATQQYPASLCWHIIRSYIKGFSADCFLEPNEYQDLAQEQRSVSDELYQTIYEKVWEKWYLPLCKEEGYWDDQDLARYVLSQDYVMPRFAAVFCDEAQDFTRIEVQIALRLNLFSARYLYPEQIQRVPLVFAGDQFQTLNPTGFRWESIKAQVVEQFIFALDPAHHNTLSDINYRELSYNFRSTPAIAQFSNIVHGLRAKLFGLKSLAPQQSWQSTAQQRDVVLIDTQDHTLRVQLAQQYDLVVVLPCLDGQEINYIQNNPLLQQYLRLREDGSTSITAMSVIRAKGLEFQRVVIYGFAADCPAELDISGKTAVSAEQKIQQEYFLNRLYVAITRARSQLLIIDSPSDNQKFWQHFQQPLLPPLQLDQLPHAQQTWQAHIGSLREATLADITPDANQIAFMVENAKNIQKEGLDNQDTYLLRQAANLYEQLGDEEQQKYCLAEVYYIAEDYEEAGVLFRLIAYYERAFHCFWRAQHWQNLYELIAEKVWHTKQLEDTLREEVIELYIKNNNSIAIYANTIRKIVCFEHTFSANTYDKKAWHTLLSELLIKLPLDQDTPVKKWKKLYKHLEPLNNVTYFANIVHPAILAEVAYLAQSMIEACTWWERAKEQYKMTPPMPRYADAVAISRPFPQNLDALMVLQRHTDICQQFADFTAANDLTSNAWQFIIDTAFKIKKHNEIIDLFNPQLLNFHRLDLLDILIEYIQQFDNNYQKGWGKKLSKLRLFRGAEQGNCLCIIEALQQEAEQNTQDLTTTVEVILYGLAHSEAYSKLAIDDYLNPDAQTILQFIKKRFLQQTQKEDSTQASQEGGVWNTAIKNPRLLGAVLERSQSFNDALQFYECLQKNEADTLYAKKRWLACKLRQADYFYKLSERYKEMLERSTRVQEREELDIKLHEAEQKAEKNQQAARREAHLLEISHYDDIPQYPPLPTPEEIASKILEFKKETVMTTAPQKEISMTAAQMPVAVLAPTRDSLIAFDNMMSEYVSDAPFSKKALSGAIVRHHGLSLKLPVKDAAFETTAEFVMQITMNTAAQDVPPPPNTKTAPKTPVVEASNTTAIEDKQPSLLVENTVEIASVVTVENTVETAKVVVAETVSTEEIPTPFVALAPVVAPLAIQVEETSLAAQDIPLLAATRQPITELYLLDYRLLIVRSQGRLNIEHQKTGETVSIWPKTQRIKGDWPHKQADNGFIQLQGTCLWLQLMPNSDECVLAVPEHGLSLKLHCA